MSPNSNSWSSSYSGATREHIYDCFLVVRPEAALATNWITRRERERWKYIHENLRNFYGQVIGKVTLRLLRICKFQEFYEFYVFQNLEEKFFSPSIFLMFLKNSSSFNQSTMKLLVSFNMLHYTGDLVFQNSTLWRVNRKVNRKRTC